MAIQLLNDVIKTTLTKAKYSKDRTQVANSHKAVKNYSETFLAPIAEELGIDFEATVYTFTASKSERYGVSIFGPYVGNVDGEATLVWGNVKKSLKDIAVAKSIEEVEKRCVLELEMSDGEALHLPLMQPKENRAGKEVLKKALRKGELGSLLSKSFEKPKKLSELAPGTYSVTEYKESYFGEDVKFSIYIQGEGWFNTNTALRRKLVLGPVINESSPAELEVGESTEVTSTGFPIIPVNLVTLAEAEIEVFEFD